MTAPAARVPRLAAALVVALAPAGCLSFPKGEPPAVRAFDPLPHLDTGADASSSAATTPLPLRIGRVGAAEHLRERMVWRIGDVEVGFYDDRRWTELPVRYLERALGDELHRRRPPAGGAGAAAAGVLDVRLESFAEAVRPRHEAVVVLRFSVERRDGVRREVVVPATRPLATSDPVEVASALGEALREAVERGVEQAAAVAEAADG